MLTYRLQSFMLMEAAAGAKILERERELHQRAEERRQEFLWTWELDHPAVVLGRAGDRDIEVNRQICEADGVPILRRESGGGAVLLGPGCLNYTLILNLERRPELRDVDASYRLILPAVAQAMGVKGAEHEHTDLTVKHKKFGGCAQRRLRRTLLHHGTILYAFDIGQIERYLNEPKRRPEYRQARTHAEFLTNVPLDRDFATRLHASFPSALRVT